MPQIIDGLSNTDYHANPAISKSLRARAVSARPRNPVGGREEPRVDSLQPRNRNPTPARMGIPITDTGEIEAFKAGRAWVITEAALENYIAAKQNSRQQAVIGRRSKEKCQSISTTTGYGKYPYAQQAAKDLDALPH